jgi:hypothetical protein
MLEVWARNWLRFLLAATLTGCFHFKMTRLANWIHDENLAPNISHSAGQGWEDKQYIPAYPDHAALYAAVILILASVITGIICWLLIRQGGRTTELWGLIVVWLLAIFLEWITWIFMGPW